MKNRIFQTIILVALGLLSQGISAGDWAASTYPEITREGFEQAQKAAAQTAGGWLSGWGRPSMPSWVSAPSLSSVSGRLPSLPSVSRPSMPSWVSVPSLSSVSGSLPSKEAIMSYAPTSATPGKIWSGIRGGASSLYGQLPSKERFIEGARALPGVTQTGLATYAGRPVMSAGSSIGSAGSWLGSQLGSTWSSYAPQTVQQYAGKIGSGVGSGASWLGGKISSAASYAPQTVQGYTGQAYNWLAGMSEEQKQAAVGLAAVIAAGLAAKKGYDYYRGPSAYSEFKEAIDIEVSPSLITYINTEDIQLKKDILINVRNLEKLIDNEFKAGTLSQSEADDLLQGLSNIKVQLAVISDINNRITALNNAYTWETANDLYNHIGRSPILTPEQKKILQQKVKSIFEANKQ